MAMRIATGLNHASDKMRHCSLVILTPSTGTLRLQFNHLVGSIPSEFLMNAKKLEVFHVGHNQLTGHLPDIFDDEEDAKYHLLQFHVQDNGLSGSLPKSIGRLSHLEYLELDHNEFTGWIPSEWGGMTQLEILRMVGGIVICLWLIVVMLMFIMLVVCGTHFILTLFFYGSIAKQRDWRHYAHPIGKTGPSPGVSIPKDFPSSENSTPNQTTVDSFGSA